MDSTETSTEIKEDTLENSVPQPQENSANVTSSEVNAMPEENQQSTLVPTDVTSKVTSPDPCNLPKEAHDKVDSRDRVTLCIEETPTINEAVVATTNSQESTTETILTLSSADEGKKDVQFISSTQLNVQPVDLPGAVPEQPSVSEVDLTRSEIPNPTPDVFSTTEVSNFPVIPPTSILDSSRMQECLNASGLTLLASQYDSDSDSDEVCEVPTTQSYQNRVVEIDSDSSESDIEIVSVERGYADLENLCADNGSDDDENDEDNIRNARPPKVKGELQYDDLPPIQDLHITVPEEECTELGKIHSIVEQLVLVDSLPGTVPLDLETVLFLDKGKQVLGEIFDVLGQVSDPLYCVRFNSNKAIKEKGIEVGQTVYVAPRTQHTQFIVLANLMKVRGSDASWENDVEPPERHLEYSDDEEEREARLTRRNRYRSMDTDEEGPKRPRPGESPFGQRGGFMPSRPYRGNFRGPVVRQPHYQPPSNYDIAGNSWHSNYYQNYTHQSPQQQHQQQQHQQHRMPYYPPSGYRPGNMNMPHRPPAPNPGLVINPYAMFPPPPLMQQPLFPPPSQHQPPPPPPGGY